MQIKTAGDLRGFLAGVLVDIRTGKVDAQQATSISKVAAQINQSLATEVQARMSLKDLPGDAGAMIIASPIVENDAAGLLPEGAESDVVLNPAEAAREEPKNITRNITASVDFVGAAVERHVVIAPAKPGRAGDKVWCDQCELQVTTSQAVGCKSAFCKAKEAA